MNREYVEIDLGEIKKISSQVLDGTFSGDKGHALNTMSEYLRENMESRYGYSHINFTEEEYVLSKECEKAVAILKGTEDNK